jgi:hypothetical protein
VLSLMRVQGGFDHAAYKAQADFVLGLSAGLTDLQKMTAEYYGASTHCHAVACYMQMSVKLLELSRGCMCAQQGSSSSHALKSMHV